MSCAGAVVVVAACLSTAPADVRAAEKFVPNYDEAKVPPYVLPDPLAPAGGPVVAGRAAWESGGRARTLELFEDHV